MVGPGAKAGGPNYVPQLSRWRQIDLPRPGQEDLPTTSTLLARCLALAADPDEQALLRASAASYAQAWRTHFSREHDPSQLLGEQNLLRYRPCRLVLVRDDLTGPGGS